MKKWLVRLTLGLTGVLSLLLTVGILSFGCFMSMDPSCHDRALGVAALPLVVGVLSLLLLARVLRAPEKTPEGSPGTPPEDPG